MSYACQRQSSSVMFASAPLIPPCAATVWDRVENPQDLLKQNVHVTLCPQQINRRLSQPLEAARLCYRRQWAQSLTRKCNRSNSITPFTISIAFHSNKLLYTFRPIQTMSHNVPNNLIEDCRSHLNRLDCATEDNGPSHWPANATDPTASRLSRLALRSISTSFSTHFVIYRGTVLGTYLLTCL